MLFSTLYYCYSNGQFDDYIFGFKSTELRTWFTHEQNYVIQNEN